MILSICEDPKVLEITRIINIFITIIRIIVPIALIFSLMFKLVSAVSKSDEDGLSKVKKIVPKNLIAAAIIFLVPTIVRLVVRVTASDISYENCLKVVSVSEIQSIYKSKMEELLIHAEETLSIDDYNIAYKYVKNIKDEDERQEYDGRLIDLKAKIDELNQPQNPSFAGSGLGNDIEPSKELIEACRWIIHSDEIQIRLSTCVDERYRYNNPNEELPGGATLLPAGNAVANKTISLTDYQKGVFFGEQKINLDEDSRYAFMIIYKTVILRNTVPYAIWNKKTYGTGKEIDYTAGSCSQNYRNSIRVERYDSGKYKAEIDDAVETTKYYIVADQDGSITDAHYHASTGIEQAIEAAGNEGVNFVDIIEEVIGTGNRDSKYYETARVYDCRNLVEAGIIE